MALSPLRPGEIEKTYRDRVTTQQYAKRPPIEGVQVLDLRLVIEDGGSFAELVRLDENGNLLAIPEFKVRQSSYSLVLPGSIKAFHLHYNQEDVWFVPPTDRLLIGLTDVRASSVTCGETMRLVMGAGRAQLLYVPRGVAHGCGNLGTAPATILYYVNQHFDAANPDEHRLPWDMLGKEFWEIAPG